MTVDIRIGHCLDLLREMPDHSVHMAVTSPPYWGLRDYGHPDQIGLEPNPQDYIDHLVAVFRELRRVIRKDGVLWVVIGDCYTDAGRGDDTGSSLLGTRRNQKESRVARNRRGRPFGLGPKQLVMIPARFAIAMQQDGWILRSDIVWHKPNPMPESATDRPTKSHESVFLFAASPRYFYDNDAIAEPLSQASVDRLSQPGIADQKGSERAHAGGKINGTMKAVVRKSGNKRRKPGDERGCPDGNRANISGSVPWASDGSHRPQYQRALEIAAEHGLTEAHIDAIRACGITDTGKSRETQTGSGRNTAEQQQLAAEAKAILGGYYREFLTQQGRRNKRDVWTVATVPYKGAHFATYPPALIDPCIRAGTSLRGCCAMCGAQWRRIMERTDIVDPSAKGSRFDAGKTGAPERGGETAQKGDRFLKQTAGWAPSCACDAVGETEPVPCTVLDPFMGAGTTGIVSQRLNRHCIGLEINPEYAAMARARLDADGQHGYQESFEIR